ncbi:MAG TPA: LacI family DNA-binding transcriptional regulator [Chitinophagaceae bacterium]|nr:LacI family DNA-binding transcriptional regulator [Chitinophagaceae bacterium]
MQKEITIYDLAKALQLSAATVSRALQNHPSINKKTRERIVAMAEQMGYRSNRFASNLRKSKTNTIGVIIPRLNSQFVATALAGMEKVASEAGYNILVSQSMESAAREIANTKTMFDNRVDGLLVSLAYNTGSMEHFEKFISRGIPVIFFDRVADNDQCLRIVINNYQNAYDITAHLLQQGCRRIVHITGNLTRNVYAERYHGYTAALQDAGLIPDTQLLLSGELNETAGMEAATAILQMDPLPDGIFCANDVCTASCMHLLKKNGIRVPEDIAMAGFNNDAIARLVEPNLTTVNYPAYQMGEVAASTLIQHLAGVLPISGTDTIVLPSELIIRDSSLRKQ